MYRSSNLIDERKCFAQSSRNIFLSYALYDAVTDGDLSTIEYLIKYKYVNPNIVLENYDAAPLHIATGIATEELALKIVALLLNYDADPNIQTSEGTTPLMISCLQGRIMIAKLLINHGANPFIEDTDGKNSCDFALECENKFKSTEFENLFSLFIENYCQKSYDESNITLQQYKSLYSDIESDVNCVEFYSLNTGFIELSEDSSSDDSAENSTYLTPLDQTVKSSKSENIKQDSGENSSIPSSEVSSFSYKTDRIKEELKRENIKHGPVTKTTKKVYYNLMKKIRKGKTECPFVDDEFSNYPEILRSTFIEQVEYKILKWSHLEILMSNNFLREDIQWRGGKEKQFFTYLLLDPSVSNNLPNRQKTTSELDLWKTFILSIFYIGKGKNSRPFSHLYEALRVKQKKVSNRKVNRIQNIWSKNCGVICLHIFHNIISAEAHTREAAMIDTLGCNNLTNMQSGEYYGIVKRWNIKEKRQLGLVLLYKALKVYLAEGERQIFPSHLPPLKF